MRRPSTLALSAILIAATLSSTGAQIASAAPRLHLIEASRKVFVRPDSKGRISPTQLGLRVAASGGNFQVNIWRPSYSKPFRAAQVNHRTGRVLHPIPVGLFSLTGRGGGLVGMNTGGTAPTAAGLQVEPPFPQSLSAPRLLRFAHAVFRDNKGHVAAQANFPFCPGYPHERVSDAGPAEVIFPDSCDSFSFGNPFVKGIVFGIENHWSAALTGFSTPLHMPRLKRGGYTVTVKITGRFRRLLEIPKKGSRTRFRLEVGKPTAGFPGPVGRHRPAAASQSDARRPRGRVPYIKNPPLSSRPDLIALPAWQISLEHTRHGRDVLGFAATAWNAGPSPMDVEGFRQGRHRSMKAYQYFRSRRGRVIGRAAVGHLDFDPREGHDHWHFEQFAAYSLLDRSGKRVLRSSKQSFCLAPTDPIDFTVPGADWNQTAQLLQTSCADADPGAIWVREVLQSGWGDTYVQAVAGQAFDVSGLPNGRYMIRIRVNPLGKLVERNRSNDTTERRLRITGKPGFRKVHVSPWHGISG